MHPLILTHPRIPIALDAADSLVVPSELDDLPWRDAADAMEALEAGELANINEKRQVGHYWLRATERAPTIQIATEIDEAIQATITTAEQILSGTMVNRVGDQFTHNLHIGVGGSSLGPQLLIDALGTTQEGIPTLFLDNVDPDGVNAVLRILQGKLSTTIVTLVSKSGNTVETMESYQAVSTAFTQEGLSISPQTVVISVSDSPLWCDSESALARLPIWDFVGGRTSISSSVGLFPLALSGHNPLDFLAGAENVDMWTSTPNWRQNPAALLAGALFTLGNGTGERALVVLPYRDRLALLGRYLQQLVMESVGKRFDRADQRVDQGLTVYGTKGSTDQHAFVQQLRDGKDDAITLFLTVDQDEDGPLHPNGCAVLGDHLLGFALGTRAALRERKRPSLTIAMEALNARSLGGLIALCERTVGLYAELINVNAYDQPGVEAGKVAAKVRVEAIHVILDTLDHHPPMTASEICALLPLGEQELWYILRRLVATNRLAKEGVDDSATYSLF
jgi:glucose-6-phosphate isomerase